MEAVRGFNQELSSLYESKPPISRAKMTMLTKMAMKAIKFYKHVVQSVEKFILKCRPEYKVPGLYVVDAIVRQCRHQFGADKDVFVPRFTKNIATTFQNLFKCPPDQKNKIVRVLNLWQKNSVFSSEVIQPLLDLAGNPNSPHALLAVQTAVDKVMGEYQSSKKQQTSLGASSSNGQILQANSNQTPTVNAQQQQLQQLQLLQQQLLQQTQMINTPQSQSQSQVHVQLQPQLQLQPPAVDNSLITQIQLLTNQLLNKSQKEPEPQFDKKLLEFDYGESDEEEKTPVQQETPQQTGGVQSLFSDPGLMQHIQQMSQTLQKTEQLKSEIEAEDQRKKILEQQQEEFNQQISQQKVKEEFQPQEQLEQYISRSQESDFTNVEEIAVPVPFPVATSEVPKSKEGKRSDERSRDRDRDKERSKDKKDKKRSKRSRSRSRSPSRKKKKRSRSRSRDRKSKDHHKRSGSKDRERERDRKRNKEKEESPEEREKRRERKKKGLPALKSGSALICSTTIWVGHLAKYTTVQTIQEEIEPYGHIDSINLIDARGCAFVVMNDRKSASKVVDGLKGQRVGNSNVRTSWAQGKGVKDKFEQYFDKDTGTTYIPYNELPLDITSFNDGGIVDIDSLPPSLAAQMKQMAESQTQNVYYGNSEMNVSQTCQHGPSQTGQQMLSHTGQQGLSQTGQQMIPSQTGQLMLSQAGQHGSSQTGQQMPSILGQPLLHAVGPNQPPLPGMPPQPPPTSIPQPPVPNMMPGVFQNIPHGMMMPGQLPRAPHPMSLIPGASRAPQLIPLPQGGQQFVHLPPGQPHMALSMRAPNSVAQMLEQPGAENPQLARAIEDIMSHSNEISSVANQQMFHSSRPGTTHIQLVNAPSLQQCQQNPRPFGFPQIPGARMPSLVPIRPMMTVRASVPEQDDEDDDDNDDDESTSKGPPGRGVAALLANLRETSGNNQGEEAENENYQAGHVFVPHLGMGTMGGGPGIMGNFSRGPRGMVPRGMMMRHRYPPHGMNQRMPMRMDFRGHRFQGRPSFFPRGPRPVRGDYPTPTPDDWNKEDNEEFNKPYNHRRDDRREDRFERGGENTGRGWGDRSRSERSETGGFNRPSPMARVITPVENKPDEHSRRPRDRSRVSRWGDEIPTQNEKVSVTKMEPFQDIQPHAQPPVIGNPSSSSMLNPDWLQSAEKKLDLIKEEKLTPSPLEKVNQYDDNIPIGIQVGSQVKHEVKAELQSAEESEVQFSVEAVIPAGMHSDSLVKHEVTAEPQSAEESEVQFPIEAAIPSSGMVSDSLLKHEVKAELQSAEESEVQFSVEAAIPDGMHSDSLVKHEVKAELQPAEESEVQFCDETVCQSLDSSIEMPFNAHQEPTPVQVDQSIQIDDPRESTKVKALLELTQTEASLISVNHAEVITTIEAEPLVLSTMSFGTRVAEQPAMNDPCLSLTHDPLSHTIEPESEPAMQTEALVAEPPIAELNYVTPDEQRATHKFEEVIGDGSTETFQPIATVDQEVQNDSREEKQHSPKSTPDVDFTKDTF